MIRMKSGYVKVLLLTLGLVFVLAPVIGLAAEDNVTAQQRLGYGLGREFAGTMHATIAKSLNMTEEQVYIERLKGKSIADMAKEKNIPIDTLVSKMMETRKTQIDQWVKEKKLTEAEAKTILQRMEANIRASIERKGIGPRGDGRGFGQGRWR